MGRRPSDKPWLHQASGFFCASVNGKRHYLDHDYDRACRKLRRLRSEAHRRAVAAHRDWLEAPFVELVNEFLDDIKARRAPGTYRNCRERLLRALRIIGTELQVSSVRRFHLTKIEQRLTGKCSPSTVRDTLATVQQVFNFAVRNDLVEVNPVAGYRKPAGRNRTRVATPEEFQSLLRCCDPHFRRFLIGLKLTGCRPGELRLLIWEMVDLTNGLWIMPQHKTITMQRDPVPRIVPLPEPVWKLCGWLARHAEERSGSVFLNRRGRPYTKDCVVRKMARIRKRAGIDAKAGENLVLYSNRHTYATEAVGRVSDTELATLLGHTTTRMLQRYVHLNAKHLHAIRKRASG